MKKLLVSLMAILLAVGLVGAGAFAYFNDTETSEDNTFTAGTLNLKVGEQDDPSVVHITVGPDPITGLGGIAPGWSKNYTWVLKNTGSIAGIVSIEFSVITNDENGTNEPEDDAEAQAYSPAPSGKLGLDTGELGYFLKTKGKRGGNYPGIGGWKVGVPCAYNPTGYGLNALGGNTYDLGATLGQGDTVAFTLEMSLADDLQTHDGYNWHNIDDNVIQSDSVKFNIIFHLDQAP